ncbi:nucleotidyltransferase family protein [Catenulispora rubra]|uniref:nucleotidyltransferase family protein n=1 Tax=Catenulispora rubra TaxID=280293 RepID=UPI001891F95E|nr:nucleotidyltransferase family protein [Catenulispora rubra]
MSDIGEDRPLAPSPWPRPEHHLIVALARPELTPTDRTAIRAFLTEHRADLEWGEFIDQASRHQVLPIVARQLTRHRLTHSEEGKPLIPYRWIYSDVYEGSRRRNEILAKEYALVLRTLNDSGLEYLIRKGPVLGEHVYHDPALRRISNLDVFMRRDNYPTWEKLAAGLGLQMGELSADGSSIVPFDRRTVLYWRMNLTNTSLPYARLGDRDVVESYLVSTMFSLFQPMLGIKDDAEDFLTRSLPTTLYGEPSRMLHPVDQMLDSLIQIHLRATLFYYIESGKDLLVRNFLDLAHLIRQAPPDYLNDLRERVAQFGVERSAFYSLHYTRLLYPEVVSAEAVEAFRPEDTGYLDEYGGFDGGHFIWQRSFAERLFDRRRIEEVAGRSQVPGPRSMV